MAAAAAEEAEAAAAGAAAEGAAAEGAEEEEMEEDGYNRGGGGGGGHDSDAVASKRKDGFWLDAAAAAASEPAWRKIRSRDGNVVVSASKHRSIKQKKVQHGAAGVPSMIAPAKQVRVLPRSIPTPWAVKFCLCHRKVWGEHHGQGGAVGAAADAKHKTTPKTRELRGTGALKSMVHVIGRVKALGGGAVAAASIRDGPGSHLLKDGVRCPACVWQLQYVSEMNPPPRPGQGTST